MPRAEQADFCLFVSPRITFWVYIIRKEVNNNCQKICWGDKKKVFWGVADALLPILAKTL